MLTYGAAIFLLVVLLLLSIFTLLYISGLFENIPVSVRTPPVLSSSVTLAYKIHEGPYAETGYLFTEAYSVNSKCPQCGIKYEYSRESEAAPKFSVVGALLSNDDVDSECRQAFEKAGFRITQLPVVSQAVCASFPHTSVFSIFIGSNRVYRHLQTYIEENQLKVNTFVELYDGQWIHYIGLLKDEDKFKFDTEIDSRTTDTKIIKDTEADQLPACIENLDALQDLTGEENQLVSNREDSTDSDDFDASFEKITDMPALEEAIS
ncbi:hypothetical protein P879_06269 [Paragonimus westermani]|uniref:Uncharacterized protein n=1 Tax=Paragonimus westermani TaxID=34504 RepID=A0A8T0DJN3_9TREM|nr:hypothetical protein P879_06269 [Paragonimus westermani]